MSGHRGSCHAKMSVADDCMATCGTINLDYRSLYLHFECGVFMYNNPAVRDVERDFQNTLKKMPSHFHERYQKDRDRYENMWKSSSTDRAADVSAVKKQRKSERKLENWKIRRKNMENGCT